MGVFKVKWKLKKQKRKCNVELETFHDSSVSGKRRESEAMRPRASIKMFHFCVCAYQLGGRVGKIMSAWDSAERYFTEATSKGFCPRADNPPYRHRPFQIYNPSGS